MADRFIRGCTSLPRGVEVEKGVGGGGGKGWERVRKRQGNVSDRTSHERSSLEFRRLQSGLRFDNLYARGPWSPSSCRASRFPPFVCIMCMRHVHTYSVFYSYMDPINRSTL